MKLEKKLKYQQPYSIKLPRNLNPMEEDYLRNYEHNKMKHKYLKKSRKI